MHAHPMKIKTITKLKLTEEGSKKGCTSQVCQRQWILHKIDKVNPISHSACVLSYRSWFQRERTLLTLWMKVLGVIFKTPPTLFTIPLMMYTEIGVVKPSPMAPKTPKTIKNQSRLSACMKMDLIDPFFFFFFFVLTIVWFWSTRILHMFTPFTSA